MAFSAPQTRKLAARVRPQFVKERQVEGKTLHYIEGWYAIAEANRIFGVDAWDRETLSTNCIWQKPVEGRFAAAYVTRVRLTVRAGENIVVREGFGAGEAIAPTPGQAHERAIKAAETDATKRALSTFGNSFGLALYRDKQAPPEAPPAPTRPAPRLSRQAAGGRRRSARCIASAGRTPAGRQERPGDRRTETAAITRASALRRRPALPRLRPGTVTGASSALHAAARRRAEGER